MEIIKFINLMNIINMIINIVLMVVIRKAGSNRAGFIKFND